MRKYFTSLFLALALSTQALGASSPYTIPNDKVSIGKSGSTTKIIEANLTKAGASSNPKQQYNPSSGKWEFSNDGTNFKSLGSGSGGGSGINLLDNGDFEAGITSKWTDSASKVTLETGSPLFDSKSFIFTPTASGQYYTSDSYAIPVGLHGANCAASFSYNTTESTNKVKLQAYDGANVIGEVSLSPSTTTTLGYVSFLCPSSGTIAFRLASTGSAAALNGDNASIGTNNSISDISQAQFIGSVKWAPTSSCEWTTASAIANLANDNDCDDNARTVTGNVTDVTAGLRPAIGIPSAGPGHYVFRIIGDIQKSNSTNNACYMRFSDGTLASTAGTIAVNTAEVRVPIFEGSINYTTAPGTLTVDFQLGSSGNNCILEAGAYGIEIAVYKFPSSTETAYRPDTVGSNWSGYHTSGSMGGTSWSTTSSALGDVSNASSIVLTQLSASNLTCVTAAGSLPGITCALPKAGTYQVCAIPTVSSSGSIAVKTQLVDGSGGVISYPKSVVSVSNTAAIQVTHCGNYIASAVGNATFKVQLAVASGTGYMGTYSSDTGISWSVIDISQNIPAPILVGSVTSGSAGAERIERAVFADSSTDNTACSSSPCTIWRQSGWLTSVTRNSTGIYTMNIVSGTFSDVPTCTFSNTNSTTVFCQNGGGTATSTSYQFKCMTTTAGVANDASPQVLCMGPR